MFGRHTATFVIVVSLAATASWAAPAHRPGNVNARERRQAERIKDGK